MRGWAVRIGARRERRRPWPRRRRIGVSALLTVCVVAAPVLAAAIALGVEGTGEPAAGQRSRGHDALWLGHAWLDGRKGDADLAALAARLAGTGIHDLYVHTGPLAHDGSLDPARYPRAGWLLTGVHRLLPGVRVQAWLGDVVAPEKDGLYLDQPPVRDRITAATGQALDAGFDGVHLDLEPVRSGSAGYLALLDQVRATTTARHAALSVAAPQIDPLPSLHRLATAWFGHGKWWSQRYFAEVARRVDQVAVMSYDTAMPLEPLYGGYVAEQTRLALEVTPPAVDLLIGLPAYWDDTLGHRGAAETVPAAVRGARLGLDRRDRATFGLALYVDYTATAADWTAYRDGWGTAAPASP